MTVKRITLPRTTATDSDRELDGQMAAERFFQEMVAAYVAAGWREDEIAAAVEELARNHRWQRNERRDRGGYHGAARYIGALRGMHGYILNGPARRIAAPAVCEAVRRGTVDIASEFLFHPIN